MRDKREVLAKFEELRAARLKKRKEEFLARIPRNCMWNHRMRVKGKGPVGFCQNENILKRADTRLFVCEDTETAARCRLFGCKSTCESVERDFDEVLRSPARCGNEYPKLAILIWFLQDYEERSRWAKLKYELVRHFSSLWSMVTFRWW